MTADVAKTPRETPAFFPADGETLFGIFTDPTVEAVGIAVVVLPGGTTPVSTDRNRLSVRLARRLATRGFHALRFDYHGAGESTGAIEELALARPFVGDLRGAVRWIHEQGVPGIALLGSCLGGRTVLSGAARTPGIRGVVLVSVPLLDHTLGGRFIADAAQAWGIRTYVRRAMSPRVIKGIFDPHHRRVYQRYAKAKWSAVTSRSRRPSPSGAADAPAADELASPRVLEALAALVERRVPVLFIYGDEGHRREFELARAGPLGEILERAGDLIEVMILPERVHGFRRAEMQDAVIDISSEWLSRLPVATPRTCERSSNERR